MDDFKANALKTYSKSAPAPSDNSKSVKVIVGDTFDDLVLNTDKHVLLEAYSPNCGHCKKLEPTYERLAFFLKDAPDLTIAKIDAVANEHESLRIKGYPTIKLYKRGNKDHPIDYNGDHTLAALKKFLE